MHTIETGHNDHITHIPSHMDELSSKEYLYFLNLVNQAENLQLNFTDVTTRMLYVLAKIKTTSTSGIRAFDSLAGRHDLDMVANVSQLTDLVHFLFIIKDKEDGSKTYQPARTVINFLPRYNRFYGPDDAFQNLIVIEYIHALEAFQKYVKTQDESSLDELIAILYRPRKWFFWLRKLLPSYNGQTRQKYNENTVTRRKKSISKWPSHIKYAVYLYFLASNEFLHSGKLEMANGIIDLSLLFKKTDDDSTGGDDLGMLGILYKVAETGVFGDIKSAAKQNLYDLLLKLYQNRKEYMDYKSKNDNKDGNN